MFLYLICQLKLLHINIEKTFVIEIEVEYNFFNSYKKTYCCTSMGPFSEATSFLWLLRGNESTTDSGAGSESMDSESDSGWRWISSITYRLDGQENY